MQSNLTTLGTQKEWLLLTGGRCSEEIFCNKKSKWAFEMVVAIGRWLLFGGGRKLRFDCTLNYIIKIDSEKILPHNKKIDRQKANRIICKHLTKNFLFCPFCAVIHLK